MAPMENNHITWTGHIWDRPRFCSSGTVSQSVGGIGPAYVRRDTLRRPRSSNGLRPVNEGWAAESPAVGAKFLSTAPRGPYPPPNHTVAVDISRVRVCEPWVVERASDNGQLHKGRSNGRGIHLSFHHDARPRMAIRPTASCFFFFSLQSAWKTRDADRDDYEGAGPPLRVIGHRSSESNETRKRPPPLLPAHRTQCNGCRAAEIEDLEDVG
ncbi:hypothetical protein BC826DRAFT_49285 [Russula brevipes]|nr:hypothetical protein BC826DRAFT_49285 [Russula brevipes]